MLLVPIRLETKYVTAAAGDELRIRIIPDPIAILSAAPASERELAEAYDFWTGYRAATGPEQRAATWRQFARRLGTNRAGYVARLVRPTGGSDGKLTFPPVAAEGPIPGIVSLLPDRWMATGWVGDAVAFQRFSRRVEGPLTVSPDPSAPATAMPGSGLKIDPATSWLFDYEEAVRRGMAITVPLTGRAVIAADGVSTLVVVGIDEAQRPSAVADELSAVFEQHVRSSGLAFVPQGTPTNNTAGVPSGYRREEAELADLEQRELGVYQPNVDDNASRLTRALGLSDVEAFGRIAHGVDLEHARSRDMRIALFETVLGTYVRDLLATHATDGTSLTDSLGDEAVASLRSWFVTWVTGGAPVPTLRVGAQPYGILPVMPRSGGQSASAVARRIADFVDVLIEEWRYAVASVPVLDHDATDVLGATPEEANAVARDLVARVLANNPHPRRIALRTASDWSDQPRPVEPATAMRSAAGFQRAMSEQAIGSDTWSRPYLLPLTGGYRWEYQAALDELATTYDTILKPLYDAVIQEIVPPRLTPDDVVVSGPIGDVPAPTARMAEPFERPSTEADIRGIEQQIEVWIQTDASIDDPRAITVELAEIFPVLHEFAQDVIEQLERHELRQRPLRWLDVPGLDGVLGRDELQLLLTRFSTMERIWQRAVVQDDVPPAGVTAAGYLEYLSERALTERASDGPIGGIETDPLDPRDDLPFELPGWLGRLPPEFVEAAPLLYQLVDATLARASDRQELGEALARLATVDPGELDWLVRECLGLGSNRLDAWHTSLASERLSTIRDRVPTGLYVGCYGFALDLAPSPARPSQGFIHAPSLPHAASAAVLRSGWLARGSGHADSPAAIDLVSDRVRSADWLLSGVRHGQDLGELLGASFERALHDARLDVAIRPLRQAVVDADGLKPATVDLPVDGIRLLELHRAGAIDETIEGLGLGPSADRRLVGLLRGIESAFDAVDDVTTFEAVHQLVVGNLERAGAVLDGAGPNGGRPPELHGVRTPRGALTIDVRALVLVDASATTSGWPAGTRDQFDPALDAWVASMLPAPSDVGWTATTADGGIVELRLDRLALSALDACVLASDDPTTLTPGLRRLTELARPEATLLSVDPTEPGGAGVSLTEFQLLAIELKRLVQESVPADGRSVALSDAVISIEDTVSVPAHAALGLDSLLAVFGAVATATSWADLTAEDAASLARIGLVPSPTVDASADFAALQARVVRRRVLADGVEDASTLGGTRDQIAALMGTAVPLLAPFTLPTDQGVVISAALADADELDDWLDVAATVHPNLGHLGRAIELSGFLGLAPPTLIAGQAPLLEADGWAAAHLPAPGTGGRIAAAVVGKGSVAPGSEVVGLVVDRWSERIPNRDQVTGVAFHFDAPSCEAPQTMLLAVPPVGTPWSTKVVLDSVLETIEWMQLRAVAIDDLGDYGHAVPTTVVPGSLDGTATIGVTT